MFEETIFLSRAQAISLYRAPCEPITCPGDLEGDGDVDGSDLAVLIDNPALLDLATSAAEFGRTDCLIMP